MNLNSGYFYRRISLLLAVFLANLIIIREISAQKKPAPLSPGMRYHEVIKLWGAPTDKEDREVARQEVWHYNEGKVIFTEGKLTSWSSSAYNVDLVPPVNLPANNNSALNSGTLKNEQNPSVVEEILSEIMKEPSQPDSQDSKSAAAVPPPSNMPSGNMVRPAEILPPEPIN